VTAAVPLESLLGSVPLPGLSRLIKALKDGLLGSDMILVSMACIAELEAMRTSGRNGC
jgi:hypothetical protein